MKKLYKNKRDYWKSEAQRNQQNAEFWKEEAAKKDEKIKLLTTHRKKKQSPLNGFVCSAEWYLQEQLQEE